jgi:hypothetical protein
MLAGRFDDEREVFLTCILTMILRQFPERMENSVSDKFELYDVLAMLVPGTLLVALLPIVFPTLALRADAAKFPEGFAVFCLVALAILFGLLVQAISSLVEPVFDWTIGGRPSERALKDGLGDRYFPARTAARIRAKLAARVGPDSENRSLFLFAMQKAETSENSRVSKFNGLYAFHRGILTLTLLAILLLVLSMFWGGAVDWSLYEKSATFTGVLALLLLFWNRTRQRAYYYIREVLLTAERIVDSQSAAPTESR